MAETRYGKNIVTKLKKNIKVPSFRPNEVLDPAKPGEKRMMNHVIWMDNDVVPGSFYSECVWFFPGVEPTAGQLAKVSEGGGPEAHIHPFDEVIAFFGTNWDDPHDLCGEIELWLEDEKFLMTKSFLVYIPAGMRHCPLKINRIEKPIFHFTLGPGGAYEGKGGRDESRQAKTAGSKLIEQFVFQNKANLTFPEFRHEVPKERAHRIVYLDQETVPDARFYAEALVFWPGPRPRLAPGVEPGVKAHSHPFSEMIGFFGTNPDDIHDLQGEVELWIDGEQHIMTKSFVAFVPANVVHCPLNINRIDRPMFHFTAGPGKMYE